MAKKLSIVALLLIVISMIGLFVTGLNVKPLEITTRNIHQGLTFTNETLQQIQINADAVDVKVKFIESTDGSNKITLQGKLATHSNRPKLDNFTIENGKLNLDLTHTSKKHTWSFLKWNFSDITLIVAVTPETQVPNLKIDVKVGDITINQGKTNSIDVNANVGDVKIQQAKEFTGQIDAVTDVGDVRVPATSGDSNDIIKVRADVGDITVKE
jgi:hypothetical protein